MERAEMNVASLAESTVVGGRYRIVRELGPGGMGAVYLVEHVHTGDRLAMKVLLTHAFDESGVERFKREARASARIKSEHVARVTDAAIDPQLGGVPYLVMELLDGQDLEAVLQRTGALHPSMAIAVLSQVARALDRAHALGIVHRDVKPENIFLHRDAEGRVTVKVLDFGISKTLEGDGEGMPAAHLTTTGAVMGTPLYMTPEQARSQTALVGPQTDMWPIGLIAVRMLTGETYWRATNVGDLLAHIIALPLEVPS